jgi:hypothetical protein
MTRDNDLEIRRRSAAMAPPGSSLSVAREELIFDLAELLDLRRQSRRVDAAVEHRLDDARQHRGS